MSVHSRNLFHEISCSLITNYNQMNLLCLLPAELTLFTALRQIAIKVNNLFYIQLMSMNCLAAAANAVSMPYLIAKKASRWVLLQHLLCADGTCWLPLWSWCPKREYLFHILFVNNAPIISRYPTLSQLKTTKKMCKSIFFSGQFKITDKQWLTITLCLRVFQ